MLKKTLLISVVFLFLESTALAQQANGWWQGVDTEAFADGEIRAAYCDIIDLMEGNLGGMLMSIAGIMAFAYAAFGELKHAVTAVIVGISSFAIHAMTSLYFGQLCGGQAQARTLDAPITNIARTLETNELDTNNLAVPTSEQDVGDLFNF